MMSTTLLTLDGPPESVAQAIAELRSTIEYENLAVTVTELDARQIAGGKGSEPMSGRHTSGPWRVENVAREDYEPLWPQVCVQSGHENDGNYWTLALCGRATNKTAQANARLIAAAPELHEQLAAAATALSTAASYIARDTDTGIGDGFESAANEIRALLTRIDAEG